MPEKKLHSYSCPRRHSFTLVELMVVIAIIGILLGLLAPAFNRLLTGNAVSAAERMLSSQFSLARAEAARRRCEVAIVIYDDHDATLPKSSSFQAAYKVKVKVTGEDDTWLWKWLPGTQETWLPTGAIVGKLIIGSATDIVDTSYEYPLPNNTTGISIEIGENKVSFPAIIFKPNGRLDQNVALALHEAAIVLGQGVQLRNDKYCRILEISQYSGRVSFSTRQKP